MSLVEHQMPPRPKTIMLYDRLIDHLLVDPGLSNAKLGALVGRGPLYVATILRSDSFQVRYADRRKYLNETLADDLSKRIKGTTLKVLESVEDQLTGEGRHRVSFREKIEGLQTLTKALGMGVEAQTPPQVQVNAPGSGPTMVAVVASPEHLKSIRDRIKMDQFASRALSRPVEATTHRTTESKPPGAGEVMLDSSPVVASPAALSQSPTASSGVESDVEDLVSIGDENGR